MKKTLALLLAVSLAILSGCSGGEPEEPQLPTEAQVLNIQLGAEPKTLDPTFSSDAAAATYAAHLFEGLTTLDKNLEAAPGVAESWEIEENDEGLPVITFRLDGAARWSDGVAVEAADFVYAWERALDPGTDSPEAYQLYPIKGARAMKAGEAVDEETAAEGEEAATPLQAVAVDESTLQVTLEGPCPYFLELCASSPVYFPLREDVVSQHQESWTNSPSTLVSNGAYVLESWTHDGSIRMVKNDKYHRPDRAAQEKLNFVLTADETAVYTAFQNGQLQFADSLPLLKAAEAEEAGVLKTQPQLGAYALVFNTKTVEDAKVRQALSLAVDRSRLTGEVLGDGSIPAGALIPEGVPGSAAGQDFRSEAGDYISSEASAYNANLERAKALLEEAGHEGGKGLPTLTYLTNDTEGNLKIAEAVQEMWSVLGVKTEVKSLGWNEYLAAREAGEFDVVRYSFSASGHTDPVAFLDLWISSSTLNLAGYQNERFDQLIAATYSGEEVPEPEEGAGEGEDGTGASQAPESEAGTQQVMASASSGPERELTEEEKAAEAAKEAEKARAAARAQRVKYLHEAESLLVSQDAVVAPLYHYADAMLASKDLSGVVTSPLGTRWFGQADYQPAED